MIRATEYALAEDFFVDDRGTPDAILPVLSKDSSLIEVSRLGGTYELVHQM